MKNKMLLYYQRQNLYQTRFLEKRILGFFGASAESMESLSNAREEAKKESVLMHLEDFDSQNQDSYSIGGKDFFIQKTGANGNLLPFSQWTFELRSTENRTRTIGRPNNRREIEYTDENISTYHFVNTEDGKGALKDDTSGDIWIMEGGKLINESQKISEEYKTSLALLKDSIEKSQEVKNKEVYEGLSTLSYPEIGRLMQMGMGLFGPTGSQIEQTMQSIGLSSGLIIAMLRGDEDISSKEILKKIENQMPTAFQKAIIGGWQNVKNKLEAVVTLIPNLKWNKNITNLIPAPEYIDTTDIDKNIGGNIGQSFQSIIDFSDFEGRQSTFWERNFSWASDYFENTDERDREDMHFLEMIGITETELARQIYEITKDQSTGKIDPTKYKNTLTFLEEKGKEIAGTVEGESEGTVKVDDSTNLELRHIRLGVLHVLGKQGPYGTLAGDMELQSEINFGTNRNTDAVQKLIYEKSPIEDVKTSLTENIADLQDNIAQMSNIDPDQENYWVYKERIALLFDLQMQLALVEIYAAYQEAGKDKSKIPPITDEFWTTFLKKACFKIGIAVIRDRKHGQTTFAAGVGTDIQIAPGTKITLGAGLFQKAFFHKDRTYAPAITVKIDQEVITSENFGLSVGAYQVLNTGAGGLDASMRFKTGENSDISLGVTNHSIGSIEYQRSTLESVLSDEVHPRVEKAFEGQLKKVESLKGKVQTLGFHIDGKGTPIWTINFAAGTSAGEQRLAYTLLKEIYVQSVLDMVEESSFLDRITGWKIGTLFGGGMESLGLSWLLGSGFAYANGIEMITPSEIQKSMNKRDLDTFFTQQTEYFKYISQMTFQSQPDQYHSQILGRDADGKLIMDTPKIDTSLNSFETYAQSLRWDTQDGKIGEDAYTKISPAQSQIADYLGESSQTLTMVYFSKDAYADIKLSFTDSTIDGFMIPSGDDYITSMQMVDGVRKIVIKKKTERDTANHEVYTQTDGGSFAIKGDEISHIYGTTRDKTPQVILDINTNKINQREIHRKNIINILDTLDAIASNDEINDLKKTFNIKSFIKKVETFIEKISDYKTKIRINKELDKLKELCPSDDFNFTANDEEETTIKPNDRLLDPEQRTKLKKLVEANKSAPLTLPKDVRITPPTLTGAVDWLGKNPKDDQYKAVRSAVMEAITAIVSSNFQGLSDTQINMAVSMFMTQLATQDISMRYDDESGKLKPDTPATVKKFITGFNKQLDERGITTDDLFDGINLDGLPQTTAQIEGDGNIPAFLLPQGSRMLMYVKTGNGAQTEFIDVFSHGGHRLVQFENHSQNTDLIKDILENEKEFSLRSDLEKKVSVILSQYPDIKTATISIGGKDINIIKHIIEQLKDGKPNIMIPVPGGTMIVDLKVFSGLYAAGDESLNYNTCLNPTLAWNLNVFFSRGTPEDIEIAYASMRVDPSQQITTRDISIGLGATPVARSRFGIGKDDTPSTDLQGDKDDTISVDIPSDDAAPPAGTGNDRGENTLN